MSTSAELNPIGFLQELSQKHGLRIPLYKEVSSSGPDHSRLFTYKCSFEEYEGVGQASQKKMAKTESAKKVIDELRRIGFLEKFGADVKLNNNSNNSTEAGAQSDASSLTKNPISALNEYSQQRFLPRAQYIETLGVAGVFICECSLMDKKTYGEASTKKGAKTDAALKMCVEFNITCNGAALHKQELQKTNQDELIGKNPISALQELCDQNPYAYKLLEYVNLPNEMNNFVVKCMLDSISCEGRGPSKKEAKTEAARKVLAQLLAQNKNSKGLDSAVGLSTVLSSHGYGGLPVKPVNFLLEDFPISSSDEEGEVKKEAKPTTIDGLSLHLSSLSIKKEPTDVRKLEEPTNVQKSEEPADVQKSEKQMDVQKSEEPKYNQKSEEINQTQEETSEKQ